MAFPIEDTFCRLEIDKGAREVCQNYCLKEVKLLFPIWTLGMEVPSEVNSFFALSALGPESADEKLKK